MKWMLFSLLVAAIGLGQPSSLAAQSFDGTFYVHVNGDTVFNLSNAYIDVHAHPQKIHFTKPDQTKSFLPADSIRFLRIYQKPNSFKDAALTDFVVRKILTKKGTYCTHFLQSQFNWKNQSISFSPFCNQCEFLSYYIVNESPEAILITRKNFKQLVDKNFDGCAALEEFAAKKRYSTTRLSRHFNTLKKQKKN